MKKVLITGAAGMIGFELAKQLSKNNRVILFDIPEKIDEIKNKIINKKNIQLCSASFLEKTAILNAMKDVECVFHLGAMLGVKNTEQDKLKCIEVNIRGTQNVLDSMINSKVKKIVFASSSEVYGEPISNPITEKTITQGKTVYGITKLVGEELCKAYEQKFNIKYSVLRYFNCYGPNQNSNFVISNFVSNVMNGKSPIIYGKGTQKRSYTYVSDTAEATAKCLDNPKSINVVLNIGNGKHPINLIDLANLVIKIANNKNKIKPKIIDQFRGSDRTKSREIFYRYCDSTLAQNNLNWHPKISLNQGIKKIINAK
jgi:UDP-glucose 4-epimerase